MTRLNTNTLAADLRTPTPTPSTAVHQHLGKLDFLCWRHLVTEGAAKVREAPHQKIV